VVAADAVDKQGNANELTAECVKLANLGVEVVFMILVPTVSSGLAAIVAAVIGGAALVVAFLPTAPRPADLAGQRLTARRR
jgi:hypothetical protein